MAKGTSNCRWCCRDRNRVCLRSSSLCIDWDECRPHEPIYKVRRWPVIGKFDSLVRFLEFQIFPFLVQVYDLALLQVSLGCLRKYNVENPFDWMEFISLQWVGLSYILLSFVALSNVNKTCIAYYSWPFRYVLTFFFTRLTVLLVFSLYRSGGRQISSRSESETIRRPQSWQALKAELLTTFFDWTKISRYKYIYVVIVLLPRVFRCIWQWSTLISSYWIT